MTRLPRPLAVASGIDLLHSGAPGTRPDPGRSGAPSAAGAGCTRGAHAQEHYDDSTEDAALPMSQNTGGNHPLLGRDILEAIKASGIEFVVSLPDITTSEGLLRPLARDPALRHVRVCKEDEGVAICAGLSFCGRRGLLMMQSTGMYDSVNAIRAVAVEYGLPICMLVGLQGALPDEAPRESAKHIVRVAQPVLDALGVTHHLLRYAEDVSRIRPAIDRAYALSRPVALLIGAMLPPHDET